jgi:hypothetical protein
MAMGQRVAERVRADQIERVFSNIGKLETHLASILMRPPNNAGESSIQSSGRGSAAVAYVAPASAKWAWRSPASRKVM